MSAVLVDDTPERVLRRLTIRDDSFIRGVLVAAEDPATAEPLDEKTCAIARIASLIALDAASPSYLTPVDQARAAGATDRSEEHTSELQSRPHLVCRLLLEKKKKQINIPLFLKKKKKKKNYR